MEPCTHDPAAQWGYRYQVAKSGWGICGDYTIHWRWAESPFEATRKATQQFLKSAGLYSGPVDGIWGTNTVKGVMQALANKGYYDGPIDGIPGSNTVQGVGHFACDYDGNLWTDWNRDYTLEVGWGRYEDPREFGNQFWAAFNGRLSRGI